MQGGGVCRGAPDDDRDVELVDEPLEVERLGPARDVLGRDGRAADDEEVDAGLDDGAPVLLGALRGQRSGDGDPGPAQLLDPVGDELGLDLLGVDLLHPGRDVLGVERGDLGEQRLRVLVPGPQALEVEDGQPAESTESGGAVRGGDRVHRRPDDRDVEVVGVDLPAHRDVLGVTGPAARDDGDIVEGVGASAPLAPADLDLGHGVTLPSAELSQGARPTEGGSGQPLTV